MTHRLIANLQGVFERVNTEWRNNKEQSEAVMTMKIEYSEFLDWAQVKPSRSVRIEAKTDLDSFKVLVWVYDADLIVGQFVSSVEEIDLEARADERELLYYERLKGKFENRYFSN